MKILLVQESDWLERNPHQQHHLMDRMAMKGHEIKVIDYPIDWAKDGSKNLLYHSKIYNNVSKVDERANIQVIRPGFVRIPVLSYVSLAFSHRKEIKKQIEDFQPDLILCLGIMNAAIASEYAKKNNIPFVYYLIDLIYNLIPERILQPFGKIAIQKVIANSDLIITINQKLKELAIELGSTEENTLVIDAGINFDEFDPDLDDTSLRHEYGISGNDIVLFFMGWIYTFSGMRELAIELGKNKELYPNTKIVIVGDGDDYEPIVKIREQYDLKDQLILTGKQPYTRIPEFLSLADFCLLPAYKDEKIMRDIVPIKLYEYLAMQKVVIATDLPGIAKEFGQNNGIVYVDEAKEVLTTVHNILDNNEYEKIAIAGRKYVESNDWTKITDDFENTLSDLVENYHK
ncbi:putative teichuronic acid biosynthesis glycosyltransferase TuaC [Methanobrevibacter cuticularis]|uniref:Putative teichuronic acid biosynthesis glycosyltransferase TuaC n=1 Tax=Methanobrevibacter cuticularis TaxID=47311 RepID=A0A166EE84_9EURY|nr:glycosyltransferase [Methanobrevibacter cuticularis]KZX16556.1 putative teichuronic acid biosynthesis glycosyltransferase TuaC [Methanobrevibacter cuticularis]